MRPLARRLRSLCLSGLLLAASGAACDAPGTPLPSGSVLFQDDFSRSSSGWEIRHDIDSVFEYRQGEYSMQVLLPQTVSWSTPGLTIGEVRIEVDVRKIGGPQDNLYGVICRYLDDDNFTFLIASSDGFAGIGEVRDGHRELLSGDAMLPTAPMAPDGLANHLTAECLTSVLRLSVNGSPAAEAESTSALPQGDIGLIVGSYSEPGVEVAFDDFSARVP